MPEKPSLGDILGNADVVQEWASVGRSMLSGLGIGRLARISGIAQIPVAVWAYMVTWGIEYILTGSLIENREYGVYVPPQPASDLSDGDLWNIELRCLRSDIVEQITGMPLSIPLFRSLGVFWQGGAISGHYCVLNDSLVYDVSGRLVGLGENLPTGTYYIVDPVVALTPGPGWAHLRSYAHHHRYMVDPNSGLVLQQVEAAAATPIPSGWPAGTAGRMTDLGAAVEQQLLDLQYDPESPAIPGGSQSAYEMMQPGAAWGGGGGGPGNAGSGSAQPSIAAIGILLSIIGFVLNRK